MILFGSKRLVAQTEDLPKIQLADRDVNYVESFKCLGFTLDNNLNYEMHTRELCRKINLGIQIIKRVRSFLPGPVLTTLANSHVLCHLDYCSPLLHNLKASQLDRLLKLQKYCARVIMNVNRSTNSKPLFIQLQWLPLHQRIELNTSCMMLKIMKGDGCHYTSSHCIRKHCATTTPNHYLQALSGS